jgi:hypothetical protein
MKTGNALLVIFAIIAAWYGWTRYEAHRAARKAAQDKASREMFESYERCTEPIFQNYPSNLTPNHDAAVKVSQDAIAACRQFWLGRASTIDTVDRK